MRLPRSAARVALSHKGIFVKLYLASALTIDPKANKGISRETVRLALEADNIESRPLWKPMHMQPVFADAPYYGDSVADNLFKDGLCLPSGSNLTGEDFDRIFKVLDRVFI